MDIHTAARALQAQGRKQDALKIFEMNAKRNPNAWVAHWGLARGLSGVGEYSKALAEAQKALSLNPDEGNKKNIQGGIEKLKANKDIN
jgi:tetratricopeptide (TPR) repeat protein